MKKLYTRKGFNVIIIFVDLVLIYLSIFLAYFMFHANLEAYQDNFYAFIYISPYIGICYLILNHIFEVDKPRDFTFFGVLYTVSLAIICLFFATMAISFLTRKFAYPRSILIMSSMIQIAFLSIWHLYVNKQFLKENIKKSVLVVGYEKSKCLGLKLLRSSGMWSNVKHICNPESPKLHAYIEDCDVVFLSEDVGEDKKQAIAAYCVNRHKNFYYEPSSPEILLFNASFMQIDDIPILKVKPLYLGSGNFFFKRMVDIFLSSIAIFVLGIPMIVIALCLKIGGGSVFFRQERLTRGRRVFSIYKFRTMIENAEAKSGPVLAQETDNRITKIGHILRSTRLDEMPQILNILKGEMSIVGPRPERPFFVEQFQKEMPEYNLRHRVKAGLTGLAQIQGKYNTTAKDKLKYDLLYINGYSVALDIKLIMRTFNILLRKNSTEGVKQELCFDEEIEKLIRKDDNE